MATNVPLDPPQSYSVGSITYTTGGMDNLTVYSDSSWATWTYANNITATTCSDTTWYEWTGNTAVGTNAITEAVGRENTAVGRGTVAIGYRALTQDYSEIETPEYRKHLAEVNERAAVLLKSLLTEPEWLEYKEHDSILVLGSDDILYEVGYSGWQGMIYAIGPDGSIAQKLCCHPPHDYPRDDRVAAVMLALRSDAAGVVQKANSYPLCDDEKNMVRRRTQNRLRLVA